MYLHCCERSEQYLIITYQARKFKQFGFFSHKILIFSAKNQILSFLRFWYQSKKKIELASLARVTLFDLSAVFVGRDEF